MTDSSLQFGTVDTARDIFAHNFLHLAAITFLFYDHLITSGNEIDYLWRRPKSASAYWFFFNRYFAFFGNITVTALEFTSLPLQSCKQYNLFRQLMLVLNQVLVCILLTLRIYALYSCSVRILTYMVGSGAVLAGISCWALFGQKSAPAQQSSGCHIGLSRVTAIRLASAWEALFIYDSILFSLIVLKTWRTRKDFSMNASRTAVPILYIIFRDGATYFAVMALANLTNILTFYLCDPFMRGVLSTFASAISVTMMSRLMLNLHETAESGIYSTTRTDFTSTNMECGSPTADVELDTIWSGGMYGNSTVDHATQSFRPPPDAESQANPPAAYEDQCLTVEDRLPVERR